MCSTDYEMLVSHSPPVFSHSPPTGGFLTEYAALRLGADTFPRSVHHSQTATCRSMSWNTFQTLPNRKAPASPKRPCLVIKEATMPIEEDPTSPTKLKKRVVFADDKGMSLTHVRVMTEPSNVPPLWTNRFLAEVTQGINADPVGPSCEPWEVMFPQPASDYVEFRKRLDTEMVSLENVIVKESDDIIVGTVKVKNVAFHKEVFVRWSTNSWKSYEDCYCIYVPSNLQGAVNVIYDTFSFKIPLPPKSKNLQFCVCYRCEGTEYWDNNRNKNYSIVKKLAVPLHKSLSNDDIFGTRAKSEQQQQQQQREQQQQVLRKCAEIVQAKLDSWSEFASWTHLENSNPYW